MDKVRGTGAELVTFNKIMMVFTHIYLLFIFYSIFEQIEKSNSFLKIIFFGNKNVLIFLSEQIDHCSIFILCLKPAA